MDFTAPTSSNTSRSAKIFFSQEDIRRINFNSNVTFVQFKELVRKLIATSPNANTEFRIRYHDDENDLITVETEEEWLEALSITQKTKALRITVDFKKVIPTQQQQQAQENPLFDIINQFQTLFGGNSTSTQQQPQASRQCGGCPWKNPKHFGVTCDGCEQSDFSGERYKCDNCDNFDFCGGCYAKRDELKHDPNHTFSLVQPSHPFRRGGCRGGWRRHAMNSNVHFGITCDGCGIKNFTGIRYKCEQCNDFDFCETCFAKRDELKHDPNHTFIVIEKPRFNHGHCPYFGQQQQEQATATTTSPVSTTSSSSEPVIQQNDQPIAKSEEKPVDENEIEVVYAEPVSQQQENSSTKSSEEQQPIVPPSLPSQPQTAGRFNWFNPFLQQFVQPQQQASVSPAPFAYDEQLKTMKEMGFYDHDRCVQLLNKWKGNLERAANSYFDNN